VGVGRGIRAEEACSSAVTAEDDGVGSLMPDWDQTRAISRSMPQPVALSAAPL
jgi:hypothetical protein